jgi:hypothetical protein
VLVGDCCYCGVCGYLRRSNDLKSFLYRTSAMPDFFIVQMTV